MDDSKFWDKVASGYAKGKIKDIESYEKKLKVTQEYFDRDMLVTEVGCGTGMTAVKHAPFVKQMHATDISQAMIDLSKNRAVEAGVENISFEVSDVLSLSIEDESQDAILAMSLLHLLPEPGLGLDSIHKKLKPGGLFISSTICLGDKMNFVKGILPFMRLVNYAPSVVHFYKKDDLLQDITSHGFDIEYEFQPDAKKATFVIARKV